MSTEIQPIAQKAKSMRTLLMSDKTKAQFQMALPNVGLTAERFVRMAMTAFQRQPKLYECTPQSVMGCLVQAAQSGLSPSGISGECYLVPFRNKGVLESTFIPGYRGLMKVARRSGEVLSIAAECVHANDDFKYQFGSDAKLLHIPATGERGEVTHVWALAKLKGGGEQFMVLTVQDVKKIQSQSKASQNGPWITHWDEMAKKSALRKLCKYLPISDDEMRLVELGAQEEAGLPQNFDDNVIDIPASEPESPEEKPQPKASPAPAAKPAAPAPAKAPAPAPKVDEETGEVTEEGGDDDLA